MAVVTSLMPAEDESALDRFYAKKSWPRKVLGKIGPQTKLTWAFIVLMAVALASYGYVSLQDTRRKLTENLKSEAQQASALLSIMAAEMPSDLSVPKMRRMVGPFVQGRDILFVTLIDENNQAVLTETRTGPRVPAESVPDVRPGTIDWVHDDIYGDHIISTSPVLRQNRPAGFVRVGVSLQQYGAQVAETTDAICRVGFALIFLAIPTAWLIVRRLFKPVRKIVKAVQKIAVGDFDVIVPDRRSDLMGDLARAFNHMVRTITHQQAALTTANQQLAEANRDLETKIEHRTAQLETANKCLNAEITEKEEFLRAISHDLNAPLRNISGMVSMLQRKKDTFDKDTLERFDRIKFNVEHETTLINELLELSRIKTRRGQMEPVHLEEMVWNLRGVFENDLRTKDIAFVIDSVLPQLHAETPRVRQIFQNLIDNAIKYMGGGYTREIHVGCVLRNDEAEFYVRDTGQGISPDEVGKVFVAFRRGKREEKGTGKGIGLASVKSIVENYAGRIWVESKLGEGTTFRFTINGQYVPQLSGRTVLTLTGDDAATQEGESIAA